MNSKIGRCFWFAAVVVCCMFAAYEPAASASSTQRTIEYQLPCLTVLDDEAHGQIHRLPLRFSRTGEDKPLRILIGDDTPGGSGQTIRNSVWLAAVTAAMLRNDTMHGVTISLEFSGSIDGPSAGGVICLAILSALDGRTLPDDFAMTGTILPDGTIGVVGGVPEKMRAAASSGVRQIFVPAFLRIVEGPQGEEVDLSRLAEELKVELHRVRNIAEAYAILHHLPYSSGEPVNVQAMTKLPKATEDVLKANYQELRKVVEEFLAKNSDFAELSWLPTYRLSPEMAEKYYKSGKFLPAAELMFRTCHAWLAWNKTVAYVQLFQKEDDDSFLDQLLTSDETRLRKQIAAIRKALSGYEQSYGEEQSRLTKEYLQKDYPEAFSGYAPYRKGLTEIAAQLEPVGSFPLLYGSKLFFELHRVDDAVLAQAGEDDLVNCWGNELNILECMHLSLMSTGSYGDFLGELGETLPQLRPNRHAPEVEHLFYTSAAAVGDAAEGNLAEAVEALNESAEPGEEVSELDAARQDSLLLPFRLQRQVAASLHGQLSPDSEERPTFPEYHLQASLKAQVEALAMATAMQCTYGADDSGDFIPYLQRNAREAAVRNISECVKAGIPCLPAICDFEIAEAADGSPTDILIPYWRASLYAKALLMSFQKEREEGRG